MIRKLRQNRLSAALFLAALFFVAPFLAALFAGGCGHPVQETAAHKIADMLPRLLGPAAHYEVQVDGDPFALGRGRARAVHIQGEEVHLSPSITLDTLNAIAHDLSFRRDTRRLEYVGRTEFTATLGQEHLTAYLAQSRPLLPGLQVALGESNVQAQVPVTFLGIQTTAALTGTLAPSAADSSKLDFVTDGAHLGIVPLPAGLVNLAVRRLNPVLDLSRLRVPLSVTNASVAGRRLTLSGTADLGGLVSPE